MHSILTSAPALRGGGERCGRPGPPIGRGPAPVPYLLHTYCEYKSKGKNIVRTRETIKEMPAVHAKSQRIPSREAETSHWLALSSFFIFVNFKLIFLFQSLARYRQAVKTRTSLHPPGSRVRLPRNASHLHCWLLQPRFKFCPGPPKSQDRHCKESL
jgi:hypothetical protein